MSEDYEGPKHSCCAHTATGYTCTLGRDHEGRVHVAQGSRGLVLLVWEEPETSEKVLFSLKV